MPSWYVHMQAAAETMERLKAGVPPGFPLTQAEADALFAAAHDHRNYLATGAIGPDLFFLLPDFHGDQGKGLLALVQFALDTWKAVDDGFVTQWETWMAPVIDDQRQLANAVSGGMLGEVAEVFNLLAGSLDNLLLGIAGQMQDVFGLMSSGTQRGWEDSAFFWSDMFHYRRTYQFARTLYENALHADEMKDDPTEPSRVPKQQAFALGWMSHCATDVAAHPFTNAKCGGPYRTHWQRHHVIENHIDGHVYATRHGPTGNYASLDTAALHFRLAYAKGSPTPDPAMPDDEPGPDWFPSSFAFPAYPETDTANDYAVRAQRFDMDTEELPDHLCELLLKTMQDVYTGPDDMGSPRVLQWDDGKHEGSGGRPTAEVLKQTFQLAYTYAKFTSTSGLSPRMPMEPPLVNDHSLPRPPGLPADGSAPDPNQARELTLLDILLAILAFAIWVAEVAEWLATSGVAIAADLVTWPAREALYHLLVVPAWDLYMRCRLPLVLEGFISPKPGEVSPGLVRLGLDEKGAMVQLRADLDAPMGFATLADGTLLTEPSGLDPADRGAAMGGFGMDPAYPRAMVTDLDPPWLDTAPADAQPVYSEFVAPWRYPAHNMAGMRNGWEAPRAHVGPYVVGDAADVLMGGMPGSDSARHRFEAAATPDATEAASAELLPMAGANLGDPIDYGAYLVGQLTGRLSTDANGARVYAANDAAAPLPDFNLDADRGYAYRCWDYQRHAPSVPHAERTPLDTDWPDQWRCAPQMTTFLSTATAPPGGDPGAVVREWYGYQEPLTVPQRYQAGDNPHHASRYDPLKRLAHAYLPPDGPLAPGWDGSDLQVGDAEMRAAGMSPTGRKVDP
jgi:hypothetical protein